MSSNRPYLIRGLYDWITDNGLTPHILADAGSAGVAVPPQAVKDGKVVLNIASSAVRGLELGNDYIVFDTRFAGQPQSISIPVEAVLAVYARENGQGMLFPQDEGSKPPDGSDNADKKEAAETRPNLRVVK